MYFSYTTKKTTPGGGGPQTSGGGPPLSQRERGGGTRNLFNKSLAFHSITKPGEITQPALYFFICII